MHRPDRLLTAGLACALWLAAAQAASGRDAEPAGRAAGHGFGDAERWAKVFDDPGRDEWQKPRLVIELLGLRPGDRVADLGAGTGYFTHQLAMAVGSAGRVWAVDIEPTLIEHIEQRKDMDGLREQLVTVLADPDDPKLPEGEIDVVLVVDTWHHIADRVRYIERLDRSLVPNGRIVIIDWREGDLPMGPPPEERLPRATVVSEFEQAGWRLDTESVMLPYQYFLVFEQP